MCRSGFIVEGIVGLKTDSHNHPSLQNCLLTQGQTKNVGWVELAKPNKGGAEHSDLR
jgi:hypothetical protein